MATRPTGPIKWADSLLNNGPLGGPSRIDPSLDRQLAGWAWADKPDFETFNGWMYNVYQLLQWSADQLTGTGGDETVTRTITINNGDVYSVIQEKMFGVGRFIPYNVSIIIEWESGTYNIGANQLVAPEYAGGGLVVMKAITSTGGNTITKAVTVTGSGARMNAPDGLEEWQERGAYTLMAVAGNQHIIIGEMEFIMTGTYSNQNISVIRVQRGRCSLQRCSLRNQTPSVGTAFRIEGYVGGFGGEIHATRSHIEVPTGALNGSNCIHVGNGGTFSMNLLTGFGDYAYNTIFAGGYFGTDGIVSSIAQTRVQGTFVG